MGVGAGLRTYSVGGRAVIDGYDAGEVCPSGRGQLLVPWPNRIEDGRYEFGGRSHQLPLDEPERRNAIHGLTRWSEWSVADRAADRVAFEHVLYPRPGYPFSLALRVEYSLSDEGLAVRTEATNVGSEQRPVRGRLASVPGRRPRRRRRGRAARAGRDRSRRGRARHPRRQRIRGGRRARLPRAEGDRRRRSSTTASPTSSARLTAGPGYVWARPPSGPTRATRT